MAADPPSTLFPTLPASLAPRHSAHLTRDRESEMESKRERWSDRANKTVGLDERPAPPLVICKSAVPEQEVTETRTGFGGRQLRGRNDKALRYSFHSQSRLSQRETREG